MTTARVIMTDGAECVRADETLADAARKMRDLDVGALPICGENNRLTCVITDRDRVVQCLAEGTDPTSTPVSELAEGKPVAIGADDPIDKAMRTMIEHLYAGSRSSTAAVSWGRVPGHREGSRAQRRGVRDADPGGAGVGRAGTEPHHRHIGLRRCRGDRPDLLPRVVRQSPRSDPTRGRRTGLGDDLDYTANAINKALVAPYSPRPTSGSSPTSGDQVEVRGSVVHP
jgi:CBS domain-containing protein